MVHKGSMWAWGAFIATLLVVGLLYIILDKILANVQEPNSGGIFYEAYFQSSSFLNSFWYYLPGIIFLLLVVGVIAISVRKKEVE